MKGIESIASSTEAKVPARGDGSVTVLSAEGVQRLSSAEPIAQMTELSSSGQRVIVVLDPVVSNRAGVRIARAADVALHCVGLGESDLASARCALELAGPDRFIGCALVRPAESP